MRCLYAIPSESVSRARAACESYAADLKAWRPEAIEAADHLAALVEVLSGSRLCVEDSDWEALKGLGGKPKAAGPLHQLLWSGKDASRVAGLISGAGLEASPLAALASWLRAEVERGRSVVVLAR